MMILNTTADIIDAIVDCELTPIECTSIYKTQCVGCVIPEGGDMDGLLKSSAYVEHNGTNFVVYWPRAPWDEHVAEYIATLLDPSGYAA